MKENIHWLGHACVKITGEKIVYVDPYEIPEGEPADVILITHNHYDHLSLADIKKIRDEHTVIVVPEASAAGLDGRIETVNPGDEITVSGIRIRAVPAYNIGKGFHPKESGFVGYVFTVGSVTYYHAGDSDRIPEMKDIEADVVFLPVGGTYTMNAEEAAGAVKDIGPKAAVPIHWGSIVGQKKDAETLKSLCECDVWILEKEGESGPITRNSEG